MSLGKRLRRHENRRVVAYENWLGKPCAMPLSQNWKWQMPGHDYGHQGLSPGAGVRTPFSRHLGARPRQRVGFRQRGPGWRLVPGWQ
jgi:hypothetical protein